MKIKEKPGITDYNTIYSPDLKPLEILMSKQTYYQYKRKKKPNVLIQNFDWVSEDLDYKPIH